MMLQSTIRMGATFLALALMLCTPMLAPAVQAQEVSVDLSADLTEAEFQAMLGRLSDEQVRDILIAEFAERRIEESAQGAGLLTNSRDIGETLTTNAAAVFAKLPELGAGIGAVFTRLSDAGGVGLAFVALAISLLAGGIVRYYWRKRGEARQISIGERNIGKGAYGSVSTIVDAIFVLLIALSGSAAFALTAMAVLYLFFHHPDIRFFVSSYVAVVTVVLIVRSVVDILFPRSWPMYRLVALRDQATQRVHWVVIGLAALWMFETITSDVMAQFGAPAGTPDLLTLLLGLLWITMALSGVYWIHRATTDLLPPLENRSFIAMLSRNWAAITGLSFLITWIVFTGGALLSGDVDVVAANIFVTMLVFLGLWVSYRVLVHYLRAQDMNEAVKLAISNAVRALLFAAGLIIILSTWGLDPATLAASGTTGRTLQTIINVLLTAIIGWAIWDFLRTIIDVRVAAEKPEEDEEESGDAEGGLGASRTATLLPLLRSTALVVIGVTCLFAALSSLGVNVGPLVAGAGVIGLAIGFGAQTLVKDVVSGVFFLIDDAFRRGEYIDLGTVKGTVERISVRSLQLRHHLGAVHTIPFGDIAALTNYSRDWVIMKLPLRLTFDTDPQQVKKIIKRIGAEFMEDELVGDGLLEPPKSQGVIQMEDSAMILRVKFKAIPGRQFVIRRELLHRIRAAFEEAGIRFANREVTVRVNETATPAERQDAINAAASETASAEQPAT
ncbi:MAG: mechanosensitive ion channel family protein [Paracoccaceae bacterium]|mgnify:CR=1 FL=1